MKIMLFTDTLGDLNGVSRFIQDMGSLANQNGYEFTIVTSTAKTIPQQDYIINLPYRFKLAMPFYQELDMVWPNKKLIENLLDEHLPDIVHISTPGTFGWIAKNIAEKKGYPLVGTYHTDFPAYIKDLTGSTWFKHKTDKLMMKFYASFKHVFSRSDSYLEVMANDIGIEYERASVIYPGTQLKTFNKTYQYPDIWNYFGLSNKRLKVLYVGRVNIEKNIPFLTELWQEIQQSKQLVDADLIMVGEGRYRKWADKLRKDHAYFLGPVTGEKLSQLYASADLFVFPSNTDTLGQVVMEAQASGLYTLVSDIGGPQTLVIPNETGEIIKANSHADWSAAISNFLIEVDDRQAEVQLACRQHMLQYNIESSFQHFIATHKKIYTELVESSEFEAIKQPTKETNIEA